MHKFFLDAAACARQTMVPPPTSQAMNHLLVGKNALVSAKNRPLSLPSTAQAKTRPTPLSHNRRDRQQGVTLHWKDTKKAKQKAASASGSSLYLCDLSEINNTRTVENHYSTVYQFLLYEL